MDFFLWKNLKKKKEKTYTKQQKNDTIIIVGDNSELLF